MLDLDYTGHPLFDVGLAAIVACAEKEYPNELDEDDLEKAATFIEEQYTRQPLTSFLTTSLMNSDFTQPAFEKKPERRRAYARRVARSYGENAPHSEEVCVFTGKPALGYALSLKVDKEGREELPPGRAFRQHIPLITGEGVINFSPWGDQGLPISGEALLCLQFFPMGCYKCAGRLLAVHSDNPDLLLEAAHNAWRTNNNAISFALTAKETKLSDASSSAPSLLIETMLAFTLKQESARRRKQPYSVTAYHLTNSGQSSALDEKSPPLKIYHLPMNLIRFLQASSHPDHKEAWYRLVARGQERLKPAKTTQASKAERTSAPRTKRNFFYDDLFRLPEETLPFIRTHLKLPLELLALQEVDRDKQEQKGNPFIPWTFTTLFSYEVMHMEKERIAEIKRLGEVLATYVNESDDRRFLNKFYAEKRSDLFRDELLRADRNQVLKGKAPLFRFDNFCSVFFTPDGDELRLDWQLARDLVCIRMLECLYDQGYRLHDQGNILTEERDEEQK